MKKLLSMLFMLLALVPNAIFVSKIPVSSAKTTPNYYTIHEKETNKVLFTRGEVEKGDQYISSDNKLYEIDSVNESTKTGTAVFVENVTLPKLNVKRREGAVVASAATKKVVGVYHTHNDESYTPTDGYDSVYGKGGIHDVGAKLVKNLEKCGMTVYYDETLHLPHNSGAYTRSQATASRLLQKGAHAIFDIHRDSTPRKEYVTEVNGKQMSKVRMVVGKGNINSSANKEFALKIKAYADEVYPNFIKDIYLGRGNYNQQLTNAAMLFEFGADTIEKDLALNSTLPLAKTLDVVMYGTQDASEESLKDVTVTSTKTTKKDVVRGIIKEGNRGSLDALWIVLGVLGYVVVMFFVAFFTNKTLNYHIKRFFSEITAGIFGKKKPDRDI